MSATLTTQVTKHKFVPLVPLSEDSYSWIFEDTKDKSLSDWISMSVKPELPGAYLRYDTSDGSYGFQYWNGTLWEPWSTTLESCIDTHRFVDDYIHGSIYQDGYWKGILE